MQDVCLGTVFLLNFPIPGSENLTISNKFLFGSALFGGGGGGMFALGLIDT